MDITKLAIKRPISSFMLILTILIFGISALFGVSKQFLPEMEMPVLMVHTAYQGADPETVDEMVSKVIEENAETLSGLESVETYSYEDYSLVKLQYEYGTDPMSNYLKLQNVLAGIKQMLPEGSLEPVIIEMDTKSSPSLQISAYAKEEKEILAFLNEGMLAELENLPAVAKVDVYGGEISYVRVELQSELLERYGLNLRSIAEFMNSANFSVPIGTVEQGKQNLEVTSSAKVNDLQEIKNIPLKTESGALVRLEDVANISWAVKDADTISRFNGKENVMISITRSQRADALELSKQVQGVLEKYEKRSEQVSFEVIYDGGEETVASVRSLGTVLFVGILLALAVVWMFFGNFKTVLVAGSSLVVSLAVIFGGIRLADQSVNLVTMGALLIAVGLLLDLALEVVEACSGAHTSETTYEDYVIAGAGNVKKSVLTSVVLMAAVCIPFLVIKGFSAQLFQPLAYVILFTAVATWLNARVVVPFLFAVLKPKKKNEGRIAEIKNKLEAFYEKNVRKLMKRKETVIAISIFLFAASCAAVIFTDRELIPESEQNAVRIDVDFRMGMKISEIEDKLIVLEEFLEDSGDVESYSTTISGSSAEIYVSLKDDSGSSVKEFKENLKSRTEDFVGIDINVSNVSNFAELEIPDGEEVVLESYDLEVLKQAAREYSERSREIPGVIAVLSDVETEGTKLEIMIDSLKAMNYGLTAGQIAEYVQELADGQEVMVIEEEGREYSVCLEYPDGLYVTPQNLMNATIVTPEGIRIALSEIATLEYTDAQECIIRKDGKYRITMRVTFPEKYREDVCDGLDRAWGKMNFRSDVTRGKGQTEELMIKEFPVLYWAIGAAVFLIFVIFTVRFESLKYALTLMLSIPFGLFGAFLLVFFTGTSWNLVSLIGIVFLVKMIVTNGMRYTARVEVFRQEDSFEEALVQSGRQMLWPTLAATLAVTGVLLPLAVWPGVGTSLMRGMALVMAGGIFSGTILILLLLPVFYQFLYGKEEEVLGEEENLEITQAE